MKGTTVVNVQNEWKQYINKKRLDILFQDVSTNVLAFLNEMEILQGKIESQGVVSLRVAFENQVYELVNFDDWHIGRETLKDIFDLPYEENEVVEELLNGFEFGDVIRKACEAQKEILMPLAKVNWKQEYNKLRLELLFNESDEVVDLIDNFVREAELVDAFWVVKVSKRFRLDFRYKGKMVWFWNHPYRAKEKDSDKDMPKKFVKVLEHLITNVDIKEVITVLDQTKTIWKR